METLENNSTQDLKAFRKRIADLESKVASLENVVSTSKEYLTLEETALFLGCTRSQLYKMTHERTVPFYKPTGKMVYFEKAELIKWIRQNKCMSNEELDEQAHKILQNLSTRKS